MLFKIFSNLLVNFSGNIAEISLFNDSFTQKEIDKSMKEYIAKNIWFQLKSKSLMILSISLLKNQNS